LGAGSCVAQLRPPELAVLEESLVGWGLRELVGCLCLGFLGRAAAEAPRASTWRPCGTGVQPVHWQLRPGPGVAGPFFGAVVFMLLAALVEASFLVLAASAPLCGFFFLAFSGWATSLGRQRHGGAQRLPLRRRHQQRLGRRPALRREQRVKQRHHVSA